jgi:hypothetical protein
MLPFLTALAAAGLMIVMASAAFFHLLRGESGNAITTVVPFVLVTVVTELRWKVKPIAARVKAYTCRWCDSRRRRLVDSKTTISSLVICTFDLDRNEPG